MPPTVPFTEQTPAPDHRGSSPLDLDAFASLQSLLLETPDVDRFLQELAGLAAQLTPRPVSCGITVAYDRHPITVAASDELARELDETQYEVEVGPCLHAMRTGTLVHVSDTATDDRWPAYLELAREQGLRSVLAVPLLVADTSVGAVNLYSTDATDPFDADVTTRALLFAAQASSALLLALRRARDAETAAQLETALASRSVIDQALGILMGQQRCDADAAFAILRSHSQNNNRKLRDVASEMVRRATAPSR